MRSKINIHLGDCMEAMAKMPDNAYDLAIVDPPYGIDINKKARKFSGKKFMDNKKWDLSIPDKKYFSELSRVSKNQIIWGGNYFLDYLGPTKCMVVWDKYNTNKGRFADGEIAWTSFIDKPVRIATFEWLRWFQPDMKNKQIRIHPTQKPVQLYEFLLREYANPNDKILDTHGGSMSIAIACWNLKYDLDLWEIDEEYYKAGLARLEQHKSQLQLF